MQSLCAFQKLQVKVQGMSEAESSLANGTGKPVGIVGITRTPTPQVPVPRTPRVYPAK